MKKIIFATLTFLFSLFSFSQFESSKQVYESPKLQQEIVTHKTIAILPYNVSISYKRLPKTYDAQANKEEENNLSQNLQSGMYTYILRKSSDYSVIVQDIERTNALLKKANAFDNIDEFTPDALAKILGVDAVIKCKYAYEKTSSEGVALVKSLLIGFGTGKVATGELTLNIFNGKDGELLWRFYKQMNEDIMSSANMVVERMMRKVGRNFPYQLK